MAASVKRPLATGIQLFCQKGNCQEPKAMGERRNMQQLDSVAQAHSEDNGR